MTQRLTPEALSLTHFDTAIAGTCPPTPKADRIEKGIPIYEAVAIEADLKSDARAALLNEWTTLLKDGAGVFVISGATQDTSVIDRATQVMMEIIAQEKVAGEGGGDHFAAAGLNDRIWNALEKHALADPENFVAYYANPFLAAAAEAWLGPRSQMTAQVNLVHPGGQPQSAHCDYHLGFMSQEQAAQFPAHIHALSAGLTLQGAIAHVDMSIESGPTKLLPGSQRYGLNYLAFHHPEFKAYFEDHYVQLPLKKGDLLWFNPGLFHAAGENRTSDVERLVNLFQVSSAFGRPMESVDRKAMLAVVEPIIETANLDVWQRRAVIAATAESYAFPTSLDDNPPVGGLAPAVDWDRLMPA